MEEKPTRVQWTNKMEFLMSCVAFSVGLGNVWRFPYTAYENGGGAFLVPYVIVLFIVGKPIYYMEMILGQFSSRSCVKIWSISPLFRGDRIRSIFCLKSKLVTGHSSNNFHLLISLRHWLWLDNLCFLSGHLLLFSDGADVVLFVS